MILEQKPLATATSIAVSFNSTPMFVGKVFNYSIMAIVTGGSAPTGTFKLQWSNDLVPSTLNGNPPPTNWFDIPSQSQAITADGNYGFNVADAGYTWVRVVWTFTSGTGTVNIQGLIKAIGPGTN